MNQAQTLAPVSGVQNIIGKTLPQAYDLIVFCHLRWGFVYQRPQHIISRLSKTRRVLFIEEPIGYAHDEENTGNLLAITDQLHVLQPKVRDIAAIASIIPQFVKNETVPVGWFYSAAFIPLLDAVQFDVVVYDCMDELSLFKGAPQSLIDQEKQLISKADVVFTGGKSLYDSKKGMHPNVYCYPSSVDAQHFAQAKNGVEIPADISEIPHPIVGYFGVIDERIDLDLIEKTAASEPETSFVMIGPIAKIEEHELPRAQNIHYLGIKPYTELPAYLKAFDIAMMPFALNDATKYISPTKTLEYMAAGKPIVSTRIADVVKDYSDCVALLDTPEEFSSAIDELLKEDMDSVASKYDGILAATSWDATVMAMDNNLTQLAV